MFDQGASDRADDLVDVPVVRQRTLKREIGCTGVGLHSGADIVLTLRSAPVGTGIVFRRTDVAGDAGIVPARWDLVADTRLCSMLANAAGTTVGTVEHLMAALAGCGIDNAVCEISGAEVPIMDGSSAPFVALIEAAGVVEQDAPRRVIRVLKRVEIETGGARVALSPAEMQVFDFEIEFDSAAIRRQRVSLPVVNGAFCKEISKARTFGFLHEVEAMWAAGLAKGGSLENAIVVDKDRVLNEDGLRFDDEFVRHKILDALGDLYLAGAPVIGRFEGVCSGHAANNQLLRALFADDTAWTWDTVAGDAVRYAVDGGIRAEAAPLAV